MIDHMGFSHPSRLPLTHEYPRPALPPPRPVHTWEPSFLAHHIAHKLYIYWQAGGWLSTEKLLVMTIYSPYQVSRSHTTTQECIPVGCVPPARYCRGVSVWGVSLTEIPLDRDPQDRDPLDRDPPDRDPLVV